MKDEPGYGIFLLALSIYLMYQDPPWVIFADLVTFMDFYKAIMQFLVQFGIFIGGLGLLFIRYKEDTAIVMQGIGLYGVIGVLVLYTVIDISRAIYSLIISYL